MAGGRRAFDGAKWRNLPASGRHWARTLANRGTIMAHKDDGMVVAMMAMAGQLADAKLRERVESALRGEEPARPKDEVRQEVLSGDEAAKVLGVTRRTIQLMAQRGTIRRVAFPGSQRGIGYERRSVETIAFGKGA